MPQIRVGISGWRFDPWRGTFYPKGLTQKNELHYASRCLNSIELNGSFYALQSPKSYQSWYEQTPEDFVFSIKANRFVTHIRQLRDVDEAMNNFFASGLLCLKEKLGPILWQFPPSFKFDSELFSAFVQKLPADTTELATLAEEHGKFMQGRSFTKSDKKRPVRHAIEIRHKSYETPQFVEMLHRHNVAIVIADTAGKWPQFEDVTSDILYLRLHGDEKIYVSGYTDEALDHWAERIKIWMKGDQPKDAKLVAPDLQPRKLSSRDIYVYFDNDVKVRSPIDAIGLAKRLGVQSEQDCSKPIGEVSEEPRKDWPPVKPKKKRKKD